MIRLNVWMRLPDGGCELAGELVTTVPDAAGRFEAEFEYSPKWIDAPHGFDLDPINLPRRGGARARSTQFHPPLAVMEDALPDDWGRRLMAIELRARGLVPSPPRILEELGANGLGALAFTPISDKGGQPIPPAAKGTPDDALSDLVDAAQAFETDRLPRDHRFRRLLAAGGTAGGARPKALITGSDGTHWIAKFPSAARDDGRDIVGLEATGLALARLAGLNVAESRLQPVGRRRVLLVKRFDATIGAGGTPGRLHMQSFKSLCRERPGVYVIGYGELATMLRRVSAAPAEDVRALFRQAAFNAAIGNVDDHLKNFWILHIPSGWRLSPAFDLVPDVAGRREHTLAFDKDMACPPRETLVRLGRSWGLQDAAEALDQVVGAVLNFHAVAEEHGVPGADIKLVGREIERRLELLA